MNDYYLRASDATALYNVLEAAGIVTEGDQGWHVTDAHAYALDVIGAIYKPTGKVLQTDDGEVPEMKPVDGFHANVRVINMSDFDVNKIAEILLEPPANPVRGWA
jgi:hypothetical protein